MNQNWMYFQRERFKPTSPLWRGMVTFWSNTFSVLQFLCWLASNFKKKKLTIETFLYNP